MREVISHAFRPNNAIAERQAIDAFYQSTLESSELDGEYKDIITDRYADAESIVSIERLTKRIAQSKENLFTKRTPKMAGRKPYIHAKDAGKEFLNLLKTDFDSIEKRYVLHTANPYFTKHVGVVREYDYPMIAMIGTGYAPEEIDEALETLNGMIDKIRAAVTTKEFKATIKKFQRAPNKALAGSRKYIDRHFDNCSVLCNIRVDLYLNESNYFAGELENEPVSSKESIEFIDAFIAGMEKKKVSGDLFKYCLGYIIKREYGLERGYHFHVMIIYNGHKVQEDIPYAKMIGEYWTKITGGIGTYFNCNKSKFRYKHCGIGKIHYYEEDKLKGIDEALIYMTKPDYYIRLASSDNARNFRRGEMPPLKEGKVGRDRKYAKDKAAL